MRKLSKYDVIKASVLIATFVGLAVATGPHNDASSRYKLYLLFACVAVAFVVIDVVISIAMRPGSKELEAPVSDFGSDAIKNTVSVIWLLVVAMFFFFLIAEHGRFFAASVAPVVVAALVSGRLLQTRFRVSSLLPYSFTFLVALFVAFGIERIGTWR